MAVDDFVNGGRAPNSIQIGPGCVRHFQNGRSAHDQEICTLSPLSIRGSSAIYEIVHQRSGDNSYTYRHLRYHAYRRRNQLQCESASKLFFKVKQLITHRFFTRPDNLVPVYPRQSNPRRSKPERCTRAYYGLDDFYAARQASRFRPATA